MRQRKIHESAQLAVAKKHAKRRSGRLAGIAHRSREVRAREADEIAAYLARQPEPFRG